MAEVVPAETEARQLAQLEHARAAIEQASTLDELIDLRDKFEVIRQYARTHGQRKVVADKAAELKVRAERALGTMLADLKDVGEMGQGKPDMLSGLGVAHQQSSRWQRIASLPEVDFEGYLEERIASDVAEVTSAGLIALAKHRERQDREAEREAGRAALHTGTASVIEAGWEEWLPSQPECDLLLTDPPYSTDVADVAAFARAWLPVALGKVNRTGRAYVCIGAYPDELAAYLTVPPPPEMVLADVLVWTYRNTLGSSSPTRYTRNWQAILHYLGPDAPPLRTGELTERFAVIDMSAPDARHGVRHHPWQKPDGLAERLIEHATEPDATVCDPFVGTGTFLLAAARLGRHGYGCELDPAMVIIAKERGCDAS